MDTEETLKNARYMLQDISNQRETVKRQLEYGILDEIGAANEFDMISKKERNLKRKLVNEVHVTKNGSHRIIKYDEGKGLWRTLLPGKKPLYGIDEDTLYDKLFDYYGLSLKDTSFKSIFYYGLKEKEVTENVNSETIARYEYSFKRFITDEFAKKDITKITEYDLKAYTQDMVRRLTPDRKAYLSYKGILNIAFKYAIRYSLIPVNIVDTINNRVYLKSCDCKKRKAEDKIFTAEEIEMIQALVHKRMTEKQYHGYFINGYAILFSIETGMRVGEICSLKWNDVYDNYIHIHSQQLKSKSAPNNTGIPKPKGTLAPKTSKYYYADWTKDEKGISSGGRKFPLTTKIRNLLSELRSVQKELGIRSEYVFCNLDGEWIKTDAYLTCLRRICANLNLTVTNNHAFRMSLNSNVFIPLGIPATERAALLGHSVETNLKYYSFERKDSIDDICSLLDQQNQQVSPRSNQNVISFPKTKTPEAL